MATLFVAFSGYVILILFGAPLTRYVTFSSLECLADFFHSNVLHNICLAFLMSLLTVYTPAYTLGLASDIQCVNTWVRLFAELSSVHLSTSN